MSSTMLIAGSKVHLVRHPWRSLAAFLLTVWLVGCSQSPRTSLPTVSASSNAADPFSEAVPHTRDADDAARFLAGLPGKEGSPFLELEQAEAWKLHRREMDRTWSAVEEKMIPSMREFQAKELAHSATANSLVFYPFSGPDALMLTIFFPKDPIYVMVALEPPGTVPPPKRFTERNLARNLGGTRDAVYSELHRSFFITREMDRQFRGQVTDGLMPPILHLLVRSHHTILGHRYVKLNESGQIVSRELHVPNEGNRGVEIEFVSDGDQSLHKLYYFSTNLSDVKMKDNKGFLAFLASLKEVTTYFKATSYMTHKPEFSIIRDQVLARSSAVLQDDSGIPYRFFDAKPWQVQLYGDYVRPYGSFKWLEQKDLRKAYGVGRKPLDFKIGYGFSKAPSNLLFARKIVTTAQN